MVAYTTDQVNTLVILNVLASTFSFLGASFIIANFFAFEDFKNNFAFKLILFVAIGDVINSLGNFCGAPADGTGLCYIQAFLTQFGDIVSFAWVTAIAWVIYNVIRREVPPTREDVEKWYKKIHLVIWPTTIFLSILPFFSSSYGNDNGLCWIKFVEGNPWGEIWRWLCFYIPLWGSIIYVGVVYYRIWGQLTAKEVERQSSGPVNVASSTGKTPNAMNHDVEKEPDVRPSASDVFHDPSARTHDPQNSDLSAVLGQTSTTDVTAMNGGSSGNLNDGKPPKSGGGTLQRIKFYPFVLFGCYLFATIRRFAELASPDHTAPFGIAVCQVFTSALLGTCNAILYGFTPVVRKKDSEWIRTKCCGQGDDANETGSGDVR